MWSQLDFGPGHFEEDPWHIIEWRACPKDKHL